MSAEAVAPEYQGNLQHLSVNASYHEVLDQARAELDRALACGSDEAEAQARLAVAEACRRLGRVAEAEEAWAAGYRAARRAGDWRAAAWALWSGGTLARQRGSYDRARVLLQQAAKAADQSGDRVAGGYALAGLAETGRIQGDDASAIHLHRRLLAEARAQGEPRHVVWALSGLAQIHRNEGDCATALEEFREAVRIAREGGDRRGLAWALRGVADVRSLLGDTEAALELLREAEGICSGMALTSALAYNRKMQANVYYRAGGFGTAHDLYARVARDFQDMGELRGEVLARLGLAKSLARMGRCASPAGIGADLARLEARCVEAGLHHTRRMVRDARADLVTPDCQEPR